MSFLNPVNEPVKRFSSTDADAPQINYNARVAGDVKTVLKACLVTGYGDKASAGWSIVNEVDHVAEFVIPSAAMSGIILKITDTATIPTWQHEVNGSIKRIVNDTKTASGVNATHASNGWQVIVTDLGFFYIEMLYSTVMSATTARLYYFGLMRSAITADPYGSGLWATGWNINNTYPSAMMKTTESNPFFFIDNKKTTGFISAAFNHNEPVYGVSNIDIISELFITMGEVVVGQHIGVMSVKPATTINIFDIADVSIDNRPALYVSLSNNYGSYASQLSATRYVIIFLDYWEC